MQYINLRLREEGGEIVRKESRSTEATDDCGMSERCAELDVHLRNYPLRC